MTRDQELWAVAHAVLRDHGDDIAMFIAERIGAMALVGDVEGIETWQKIGHKVLALQSRGEAIQ